MGLLNNILQKMLFRYWLGYPKKDEPKKIECSSCKDLFKVEELKKNNYGRLVCKECLQKADKVYDNYMLYAENCKQECSDCKYNKQEKCSNPNYK